MKIPFIKLTQDDSDHKTWNNCEYAEFAVARALAYLTDNEREKRGKIICRYCFYIRGSRVGGTAMTTWYCGVCQKESLAGSTATPKVCSACAHEWELCHVCGGDIHMRKRRKKHLPE